jgi:hypothetical protein
MTLLQSIDQFLENITVTDRQEESIKSSLSNLNSHLLNKDNNLHVNSTFTNGSYERDTNIRPLNDIDLFAVLNFEKWKDGNGNYPKPQAVLTKIKNYLDDQDDYKGKVKQDRPCVTVVLSDKDFDVLPSFPQAGGGYLIPNHALTDWTFTYPEQLTTALDEVHRLRSYKVKPVIKAVKYWNREKGKYIPSYHIEEVAILIFTLNKFANYEEAIRRWFENAESYLISTKFDSQNDYETAVKKIKKVKEKLTEAKELYDEGKETKARRIWKDIFDKEFPAIEEDDDDEKEAKAFSKALSEGSLRVSSAGILSTSGGFAVTASKGYYGNEK